MGVFNALVAVKNEATFIDANLAIELERLLTPWKEGRFDWYAIGVTDWHFAAYLHPSDGWLDDEDYSPLNPETMHIPSGYSIVPIRCHG
jgi:hypothetical protein